MQCEGNSNLRPILWVGKKLTYSLHQPFYIWKKDTEILFFKCEPLGSAHILNIPHQICIYII